MKAKLVFHDWLRRGQSIYSTLEGISLSSGDLHSGTVFKCEITFTDPYVANELFLVHKYKNAQAVFLLIPTEEANSDE